jgi:hypothetical protein
MWRGTGPFTLLMVLTSPFAHVTSTLYERADEIESERAEQEPPDDDTEGRWRSGDPPVDDVRGMFDGLHSEPEGEMILLGSPGRTTRRQIPRRPRGQPDGGHRGSDRSNQPSERTDAAWRNRAAVRGGVGSSDAVDQLGLVVDSSLCSGRRGADDQRASPGHLLQSRLRGASLRPR